MHLFIPVMILLLIPSAVETAEATTRQFRRCFFPEWYNASQVRVSCKKESDTDDVTQIAQYCNDSTQICRKMNKSGVSLEKDQDKLCLTITNDSYDSCFCEAQVFFDDDEKKENFTVDFSNQPTNTSLSQESVGNSLSQDLTNTSTGLFLMLIGLFLMLIGLFLMLIGVFLMLIGPWINKKMKSSRKNTGQLNSTERDFEMVEMVETSVIPNIRIENEVLGENGETLENGDLEEKEVLREKGETLAFGQNVRQERRKNLNRWQRQTKIKKKITPRATSNLL